MKERVLVFGAGVIGSVYAVRLAKAGFGVTVSARGERLAAIRAGGLRIRNVFTAEEETADVRLVEAPDPSERYDLALVTVRAAQVLDALSALEPCGGCRTVAVIGNNFSGHADQAALVGRERFVLGFGSFGGYRDAGVIVYLDGRTAERPEPERRSSTTLGVMEWEAEPALAFAKAALEGAGLPVRVSTDMAAWLVCHAAMVFPLAGGIYAAGGGQERTCRTRDALVLGFRAFRELFRALRKLGVRVEPASLRPFLRTPEPLVVRMLSRMLSRDSARVAVFGHANAAGGRDEIAGQALRLDAFVRKAGLPLPNWERLLSHFEPDRVPPLADGSRALRLRLW
jgi:2-dehydropantoate 2-reductase